MVALYWLISYFLVFAKSWQSAGFHPEGEGGGGGSRLPLKIYGGIPPLIFTNTVQSACSYE